MGGNQPREPEKPAVVYNEHILDISVFTALTDSTEKPPEFIMVAN